MPGVMHIVWKMNHGGLECLVRDLCIRQRHFGLQPMIVETGPEAGRMVEDLNAGICSVYRCPLSPKYSFVFRLGKLLRKTNPAIIHHHAFGTAILSAMAGRLSGVPWTVETIHSLNAYSAKGRHTFRRRWASHIFSGLITHRVAVSEGVRRSTPGSTRVRVIYNGIDCQRFQRANPGRLLAERGIAFREDTVVIGHVGSYRAVKNHDALIRVAAKVIAAANKPVKFICAGVGERFDEIKRRVASLSLEDRIMLLGLYADVPEFLACCDVFFMPSQYEGLPIACIEAMAAGVPPVVSDVVGLREVVVNEGVGRKFPLENENAAVDIVLELADNPELRKRIGYAAREYARNEFSLDTCVARYNELYGLGEEGSGSAS